MRMGVSTVVARWSSIATGRSSVAVGLGDGALDAVGEDEAEGAEEVEGAEETVGDADGPDEIDGDDDADGSLEMDGTLVGFLVGEAVST